MASYTKNTNFATKDTLPTGDPAKVIKGTEINTEYDNIQTAVNSKPDANSGTHTGTTSMDTVSVSTSLSTADLSATGTSTISDADVTTLDVTGVSTLADADVSTLDVTGTSTLADADITTLDVSGVSTLAGDLTVDTNTLHVDTTNNRVGIGTAAPANPLQINTTVDDPFSISAGTESLTVSMPSGAARNPRLQSSTDYLGFECNGQRICTADTSQGRFNVGSKTTVSSTDTDSFVSLAANNTSYFQHNSDGVYLQSWQVSNQTGGGNYLLFEYNGNNVVGSIKTDGSTVSYNTSSDYRLKENIQGIDAASTELKRLKPSEFNFIGSDKRVQGFIAHEVQEVVPEAVTGEKDGEEYQALDASKLIPLLTASLQEALQRIEDLEAKLG